MKGPFGLIIYGVIGIVVSLVMFTVAVGQLDTAITTAGATVNTMAGLTSIMGIYGIIFWIVISGAALALLGFGVAGVVRTRVGGKRKRKKSKR